MKDRLIEVIQQSGAVCEDSRCPLYTRYDEVDALAERILADGWIRPPCKVGQTVYVVNSLWVSEYTVEEIAYDDIFFRVYCKNEQYALECRTFMFFDERIGKTVFLTREAAEKALKERENNGC